MGRVLGDRAIAIPRPVWIAISAVSLLTALGMLIFEILVLTDGSVDRQRGSSDYVRALAVGVPLAVVTWLLSAGILLAAFLAIRDLKAREASP